MSYHMPAKPYESTERETSNNVERNFWLIRPILLAKELHVTILMLQGDIGYKAHLI